MINGGCTWQKSAAKPSPTLHVRMFDKNLFQRQHLLFNGFYDRYERWCWVTNGKWRPYVIYCRTGKVREKWSIKVFKNMPLVYFEEISTKAKGHMTFQLCMTKGGQDAVCLPKSCGYVSYPYQTIQKTLKHGVERDATNKGVENHAKPFHWNCAGCQW